MKSCKVQVNINFGFLTPLDSIEEINNFAQQLVSKIVEQNPSKEYLKYKISTNMLFDVKTKKKKVTDHSGLLHIKEYSFEEFLKIINDKDLLSINVDGKEYKLRKKNKEKFKFYHKGCKCVSCGRKPTKFILSKYKENSSNLVHFRIYSVEDDKFILMTIDHIIPKSKNGKDSKDNYQLMCEECNCLKGNSELLPNEIFILKQFLEENFKKHNKKQLSKLVEQKRKEIINKRNNI